MCAVVVVLASAARRLLGVATALPRGSAQSRESLTQDSRSAVKARLFDPLRESFGEERCALRGAGVNGLERDHHVGLSPSSREGMPLKAAPIVVCARTSLAVPVTTRKPALCVRATPHATSGGELKARSTSGRRPARSTHRDGGALRVGLRGMAGDACVSLQAPPPKVATQVSGGRDGPRRTDGDARTKHQVCARTPRSSHHPEVAPDVAILRQAQNRYVASDALASMTEATRQHRSVSRRTRRSR